MGSALVGLGACALSSIFFGTVFVPVKKFKAGNGIFVQWVMSTAILCVGMLVNVFEDFPVFQPLAMLGGMFWALGNATAVPIMNVLGLGMGMLIWGTTNCVSGWVTGRFGLFGINATIPAMPIVNYFGLGLVIIGGFLFSRINPTPSILDDSIPEQFSSLDASIEDNAEDSPLLNGNENSRQKKRVIGIIAALFAGVFYGITFIPVIYIQDHPDQYPGSSHDGLAYVFSHYCGIFATATILMVIYILFSQNDPYVNGRIIGPSLLAGVLWGVAQTSWFVANDNLSQSVTFPIISMMPGVCAALWSVVYFREIKGIKNLRTLACAIIITTFGAVTVGISK